MYKHSVNLPKQIAETLGVEKKESIVASITNFSVGFVPLSPRHSMQVAGASCCAQSCSVLSVPAKGGLLPLTLVCVCVCVHVDKGGGGGGGGWRLRVDSTAHQYIWGIFE